MWIWMCQHECQIRRYTPTHPPPQPRRLPARVALWTHPHKFACASILSSRECLTFDRLPAPPTHTHIHNHTHTLHLISLYPGQLSARTWPKEKDPSVAFLQRSVCVCVCVCIEGGERLLFTPGNPCCCSLSGTLLKTMAALNSNSPHMHVCCVSKCLNGPTCLKVRVLFFACGCHAADAQVLQILKPVQCWGDWRTHTVGVTE